MSACYIEDGRCYYTESRKKKSNGKLSWRNYDENKYNE